MTTGKTGNTLTLHIDVQNNEVEDEMQVNDPRQTISKTKEAEPHHGSRSNPLGGPVNMGHSFAFT